MDSTWFWFMGISVSWIHSAQPHQLPLAPPFLLANHHRFYSPTTSHGHRGMRGEGPNAQVPIHVGRRGHLRLLALGSVKPCQVEGMRWKRGGRYPLVICITYFNIAIENHIKSPFFMGISYINSNFHSIHSYVSLPEGSGEWMEVPLRQTWPMKKSDSPAKANISASKNWPPPPCLLVKFHVLIVCSCFSSSTR